MLTLDLQPASPMLALRPEPQLCYVLLSIHARSGAHPRRAVNWALVADASRSMRIPIIDEEQFRELVRSNGAHEVMVDGVPVWQFSQPVPGDINAMAPSALDHVKHALASVVEHLSAYDHFALVACAEDAAVLAPSTSGAERALLAHSIERLKGLRLGNETDLARGMVMALEELRRTWGSTDTAVKRLILLTDGFTQNPDTCMKLAQQAAAEGIAVSTLGLGGDFQEDVLTALADVSGGRAVFLRQAEEIPHAVAQELETARAVAAQALRLHIGLTAQVKLRRATSIMPTLAPLEPLPRADGTTVLPLGDLGEHAPIRVLLELLVPPPQNLRDMSERRLRLGHVQVGSEAAPPAASAELVATYTATGVAAPPPVLDAAARANALRLQRRALEAATASDRDTAVALLRSVAARLTELGEMGLASIALQEADTLEHTGSTTRLGPKELTYATRRLGTS
jgi:hypothetical protein